MEKGALKKLVYSIFVAVIFIGSYLAFGNMSPTTSPGSANTTTVPETVYSVAVANALILNYSSSLVISSICKNESATTNAIDYALTKLENNGNINNFYESAGGIFSVYSAVPANTLYDIMAPQLNSTLLNCTSFKGSALVSLPNSVTFSIQGQKFNILIPQRMMLQNVPTSITQETGNTIKVKIAALITVNGTIYNMSVTGV